MGLRAKLWALTGGIWPIEGKTPGAKNYQTPPFLRGGKNPGGGFEPPEVGKGLFYTPKRGSPPEKISQAAPKEQSFTRSNAITLLCCATILTRIILCQGGSFSDPEPTRRSRRHPHTPLNAQLTSPLSTPLPHYSPRLSVPPHPHHPVTSYLPGVLPDMLGHHPIYLKYITIQLPNVNLHYSSHYADPIFSVEPRKTTHDYS